MVFYHAPGSLLPATTRAYIRREIAALNAKSLKNAKEALDLAVARMKRCGWSAGKGMLFVTPVKGAKVTRAAREAGMGTPQTIYSVRIEGADRPGLGAKIARALGNAGISFRGISGIAIGGRFLSYIACDSARDQAKAIAALKKLK